MHTRAASTPQSYWGGTKQKKKQKVNVTQSQRFTFFLGGMAASRCPRLQPRLEGISVHLQGARNQVRNQAVPSEEALRASLRAAGGDDDDKRKQEGKEEEKKNVRSQRKPLAGPRVVVGARTLPPPSASPPSINGLLLRAASVEPHTALTHCSQCGHPEPARRSGLEAAGAALKCGIFFFFFFRVWLNPRECVRVWWWRWLGERGEALSTFKRSFRPRTKVSLCH